MQSEIQERVFQVRIVEHKATHLLVALCDDLPGFTLAARSEEQITRELKPAIQEMLEAQGYVVLSLTTTTDDRLPDSFARHNIVASARMELAAA